MEQVKQQVLSRIAKGENYRTIAKTEWTINGTKRRFSIAQISRWVKEKDENTLQTGKGSFAGRAFQLFEDRKGPVQAVIELMITPEEAKKWYEEWLQLKEVDLTSPIVPKRLKKIEETLADLPHNFFKQFVQQPFVKSGIEAGEFKLDEDELSTFLIDAHAIIMQLGHPLTHMTHDVICPKCGSTYSFAVKIKCEKCQEETWCPSDYAQDITI